MKSPAVSGKKTEFVVYRYVTIFCSALVRVLLLLVVITPFSFTVAAAQANLSNSQKSTSGPMVTLQWDSQPGSSRYRLQIARDSLFTDIVFDAVVAGTQRQVSDLAPGKYFWRVAPLKSKLGEFSSVRTVQVRPPSPPANTDARNPDQNFSSGIQKNIPTGNGWRVAVGDVRSLVPVHLRSSDQFDLVATNNEGLVFALDASSGIALWSTRRPARVSARPTDFQVPPLIIRTRSGLDDLLLISGAAVMRIEGGSGRELWRVSLPSFVSGGAVVQASRGAFAFLVDNSLQRMFVIDGAMGSVVSEINLPSRVVGAPITFVAEGKRRIGLAFVNGRVEVRDDAGAVVGSGDAGSLITTAPLFVRSNQDELVLVGTRDGLTALNANDLRPLGRVTIHDDAPRGSLAVADLNGDGSAEVLMLTQRGQLVTVNSANGHILWNIAIGNEVDYLAFADVNQDGVLDVMVATNQGFASAFSGRDGSLLWKDSEDVVQAANHATSVATRSIVALPLGKGALLIAVDPSHTGLRAIDFPFGYARPKY